MVAQVLLQSIYLILIHLKFPSHVSEMYNMFKDCKSLTSINISNFNTENIYKFENMFNGCTSLISLDFQNFDLSSKSNISNMFSNCKNLEYVNIKNFKPKNNNTKYNFFEDCPINIAICMNDAALIDKIKSNECNIFDCSDNAYKFRKKIYENDKCTDDCLLTDYKYEYKFKCYSYCLGGTYNNNYICEDCHEDCDECDGPYTINNSNCISCLGREKYLYLGNCIKECPRLNSYYYNATLNQNVCKCELIKCKDCTKESLNQNLCTSCDTEESYYPKYDDFIVNKIPFYNCYNSLEGYYLDEETSSYKLCYSSCKNCEKEGKLFRM